nr:NAD(P)-binding domain-containing protein [Acetobacter persici]
MRIGIIGAGRMGSALGEIYADCGHDIIFSYARTDAKLETVTQAAGRKARWSTPDDAARNCDLVILAVHWMRVEDALACAGDLSGKTVMSCCMPLDETDSELVIAHTDSGAEALARMLPHAHIVAAFQTIPSESLRPVYLGRQRVDRPSVVFCGDNGAGKQLVAQLISEAGFSPVDAGSLEMARYIEPFSMLGAELAYETPMGPEWVYRFSRLDRQ